jgi:hypothetical protein
MEKVGESVGSWGFPWVYIYSFYASSKLLGLTLSGSTYSDTFGFRLQFPLREVTMGAISKGVEVAT